MSKKVSVVIPFYNSGRYLKQCVDSVLSQTHHNLEVILINDGSTDNSAEIAEEYRQKDNRVKVLFETHTGNASALNLGLAAASGDYVTFMSAIDFWGDNNNIASLLKMIHDNHSDIAVANFFELNGNDGTTFIHVLKDYEKTYIPQKWFQYEYQTKDYLNQCFSSIYGKLFNKKLLNMVDFNNEANVISDGTTWKIYLMANKISYANRSMYVVRTKLTGLGNYHYNEEDHHSLPAIEERIAILTMIHFDTNNEINEYVSRLNYKCEHALDSGDYYEYLDAITKLDIIKNKKK